MAQNITKDSSQYTDNKEHDSIVNGKRIVSVLSQLQTYIDEAGGGITYVGEGAKGLATSEDGWSIAKIDESANPITIKHAIGTWTGRVGLTYT